MTNHYIARLQTRQGIVEEEFGGYHPEDDALDDIARYLGAIYPTVKSCVVTLPDGKEVILGLKPEEPEEMGE